MKKKPKKIKSLSQLKRDFDSVFSKYIRQKYSKNGKVQCVTCSTWKEIKAMQAGHYISRGYLSVRFDEENVHPQCPACNIFKNGNLDEYAMWLIGTYGEGILEKLNKKKWEMKKYSRLEYEMFIKIYNDKLKKLKDNGV